MLTKLLKNNLLFIVILIIAIFIRFYRLAGYPVSLNWDEISHGYNAYSILHTGRDQWGIPFPIFNFRAYGDYPTTLNMYLTVPFVAIFGLNAFSIRLPGAILGTLSVIIAYFLAKKLFGKSSTALLIMLLMAVSPWSLFPSRAVFQSTISQFFLSLGITLFFYSRLDLSAIALGLSMYSYHNTRLIAPLIFISLILIFKKYSLKSIIIFCLFAVPAFLSLLLPESRARGDWVAIINQSSINEINNLIGNFPGPHFLARAIYNKATYFCFYFFKNYFDFLQPSKLFYQGTGQYQFNIPHNGPLFLVLTPFYYLGIFHLLKQIKTSANYKFILFWFVIGLLPAAITKGDFPIIRAMSILPTPMFLIALGLSKIKSRYLLASIGMIFASLFWFLWQYFYTYPAKYSSSWQYGYQPAVEYVKSHYSQYRQIIFTKKYGEPHEFVLFYWPWDPQKYLTDTAKTTDYHSNWYWVNSFDKFKFINDWEIKNSSFPPSTLLITSPHNYPSNSATLLKTINFLDGQAAFDIVAYE